MLTTAGRTLGSAVVLVALGLSPALGYATTHVLLGLAAIATVLWLWPAPSTSSAGPPPPSSTGEDQRTAGAHVVEARSHRDPPPRGGGGGPCEGWWRGRPIAPTALFAAAFLLIALSALATQQNPADLVPLLGFSALVFCVPLARLLGGLDLSRVGALGAFVGLAVALLFHYGLGMSRAAEGFWLTDPYRLAVTTLLAATFGLGTWFAGNRWRWLSLLGPIAAIGVILLTGSRTALLGLPALLFITALCFVRRPATVLAVLVAAAAIASALLFIELPGTARTRLWDVAMRIAEGGTVGDAAINIRLGLYRAGAELFVANPLFGLGWIGAMMDPVRALLTPEQLSWGQLAHLHNDAMQFAVSGGVPGLAAWALILAAPVAGYLQLPREARTPQRLHALLVLVIGAIVLGLPDTFLAAPMTLTIYVVLAAVIVGQPQRAAPPHPAAPGR